MSGSDIEVGMAGRPLRLILLACLLGGTLSVVSVHQAQAQSSMAGKVLVEATTGLSIPARNISKYVDVGPQFGIRVAYPIAPKLYLGAQTGLELFPGTEVVPLEKAPDVSAWRYQGGIEAIMLPPTPHGWTMTANLDVGATTLTSDKFVPVNGTDKMDYSNTFVSAAGGLRVGYAISPRVTIFADGEAHWIGATKKKTEDLAQFDHSHLFPFDSAVTIPLTIGLSARLGGGRTLMGN